MDLLEPILIEFKPDLIIIASGFDMYFDDPIGNGLLTSISYHRFTKKILSLAENICEGRLSFILEGGYSLVGLQHCVFAIVNALLGEDYKRPTFENLEFLEKAKLEDIQKIKNSLKKLLKEFWYSLDKE